MRARLTESPGGDICLESDYDREFVADLKEAIPFGARSWDASAKVWIIALRYLDALRDLLDDHGYEVIDAREAAALAPACQTGAALWAPPGMPAELAGAFYTLGLNGEAPLGLAETAWKWWQRHYHEDHGGDFATSARLNEAMRIIRNYLGDA